MGSALGRLIADMCRQIDERDVIIAIQKERIAEFENAKLAGLYRPPLTPVVGVANDGHKPAA